MEPTNNLLNLIKSRRSVRNFVYKKIDNQTIKEIVDCGRWAPSGQNSQPWKVCIVSHPTVKRLIAENSKYGGIIESAYLNLVVFLDLERGYDRVKDILAIGAFIQNMLLAVHAKGLGAVWIGEILKNKEKVSEIFKFSPENYELMGVLTVGLIDESLEKKEERKRRALDEFIDWF
ncbi:MAG: nitroreductase family protein [Candidatus Lokiarchaeota archaeon]|jgi:nitroreductase|nr:nitroreductase family protein [Candidatus Lokiarchaeota archaeon]